MNREVRIWALIVSLFAFTAVSYSQVTQVATNKWSVGLNVGGQRLYGDRTSVGVGLGFEGFITNRLLKFADLSFALGYSQLKYKFTTIPSTTDLFNADLKGNFEVVSRGLLRPFVTVGLGVVNFHILNSGIGRFWDATLFGGGGFKINFNSRFDWIIAADYRFTTGDNFDNIINEGKSKDGYLNVRAGVAYKLPTWGRETP
ncbi:MAG: outer membrane beta-barrel protein, partial [bacterium]